MQILLQPMQLHTMTYRLFFILFVLIVKSCGEFSSNKPFTPPLVTIDVGQVLGTMNESSTGNTVYQYLGIPYAEPPIGSLRFEPPVPVGTFQSIIEATAFKPSCIQVFSGMNIEKDHLQLDKFWVILLGIWPINLILEYLFNQGNPPENEDCLYINVFTPKNNFELVKPVMVWLYGGGNGN
jgi:carboxylesterase type B